MTEKIFRTVEEQIQILKSRQLTILHEEKAKKLLHRISYYDVINGYNDIFLEVKGDIEKGIHEKYLDSANFELIYELYCFDAKLRSLLLNYIGMAETTLGSSLAYVISKNYGHKESQYIDRNNYLKGARIKGRTPIYEVDRLMNRMNYCKEQEMKPIVFYRSEHGYLPPWILFKYLMLGEKEKLFQLLQSKDRNEVVKILQSNFILGKPFTSNFYLKSIAIIREFRNTCAHGSRVYNHIHRFEELPYNHVSEFLTIEKHESCSRNDLTALIISLYAFLGGDRTEDSQWILFINEFKILLEELKKSIPEFYYKKVLEEMHLPPSFSKLYLI